jgi:DNA-binding response OmpR family regulator/signal recognition particle receptor subunit beta
MNRTILVIDKNSRNVELLAGALAEAHFGMVSSGSAYDGLEKVAKIRPDLVVIDVDMPDMDGFDFVEKLYSVPEHRSIPVIFLSARQGVQERLRAYRSGVKDYIIKPAHVKEIVARIQMILDRLERNWQIRQTGEEGEMKGKLEEKNLARLTEELSGLQATGILFLTHARGQSGQVYFRDGNVVQAIVGPFKAEKAYFRMIPWSEGTFAFLPQPVDVEDTMRSSNLGLLLQAKKRLEKREELLKQLPSPDAILKTTPVFLELVEKRKNLSPEARHFIELFDGTRTIAEVLEETLYDELIALERIVRMVQEGFLEEFVPSREVPEPLEVKEKAPEPIFSPEELETFQQRVLRFARPGQNTLLVLGSARSGRSDFVRSIAGASYHSKTVSNLFPHPVDLGLLPVDETKNVHIIGIPIEKTLSVFLETFEDQMFGYVVLISATEPEALEYLSYLIKTFRNRYQLPYALAITNLRDPGAMDIEHLADELDLESYEELISCNPKDRENVKMILLNMYSSVTGREYLRIPTPTDGITN